MLNNKNKIPAPDIGKAVDAELKRGTSGVLWNGDPNSVDPNTGSTDNKFKLDVNTGSLSISELLPRPTPVRVEVLNEAAKLIVGDRQEDYGPPKENFERIASYWNTRLKAKLKDDLTEREIADLMILLKMARAHGGYKRDTYVDMGGYAGLAAELGEDEEK